MITPKTHDIPLAPKIGLGDNNALLKVYMANSPKYAFNNDTLTPNGSVTVLDKNEIYLAGQACGNGWRKVFNVYAKFVFALSSPMLGDLSSYTNWQDYRDKLLLQANSNTALIFAAPIIRDDKQSTLHIVMGIAYAKSLLNNKHLGNVDNMIWLNNEFAINREQGIVVCPYFDYRQLSNIKILYLVHLIQSQLSSAKK